MPSRQRRHCAGNKTADEVPRILSVHLAMVARLLTRAGGTAGFKSAK